MQYPPIRMLVFLMLFASVAAAANWTIIGDGVQWSNANAKISVAPHTGTDLVTHVQYANFSWNGTPVTVNISFVFSQPITSGKIDLLQNVTRQVSVPTAGRVNYSILLPNVSSYVATNASCQIGDTQNTLRYIVNYSVNGTANSTVACFNSYTNASSDYTLNYQVNGTVYAYQNQTRPEWTDISSIFTGHAYGNYRVYTVNNVQFTNPTLYQTRLTYDTPTALKNGKFSIYVHAGSPDEVIAGTAPVYLELDPWWNSTFVTRKKITINSTLAYNLVDQQKTFNTSVTTGNGSDLRFTWLNTTSGLEQEVSFWRQNGSWSYAAKNGFVWVKVPIIYANANTTLYQYSNANTAVADKSDESGVFLYGDDFTGSALNASRGEADCHSGTGTTSVSGGALQLYTASEGNMGCFKTTSSNYTNLENTTTMVRFSKLGTSGSSGRADLEYFQGTFSNPSFLYPNNPQIGIRENVYSNVFNSFGVDDSANNDVNYIENGTSNLNTPQIWELGLGQCGGGSCIYNYSRRTGNGAAYTVINTNITPAANGLNALTLRPEWNSMQDIHADWIIVFKDDLSGAVTIGSDETNLLITSANISNSSSSIGTSIYANTPIYGLVNATNQNASAMNATWKFYLNGALYSNGSASNIADASLVNLGNVSNLSKGQNWTFEATITDASNSVGITTNSSTITISPYNISVGTPTFNVAVIAENATIFINSIMTSSHDGVGWQEANATLTYANGSQQTAVMSILTGNSTNATWQGSATTLNLSGLVNVTVAAYTNATPTDAYLSSQSTFRLDNTPPNATLSLSNANFVAPLPVTFSAFVTDDNLTKNATLYIGGADWGQMLNVTAINGNATFNLTVQPNASGIFNAYAIVYDYVGHPFQTANVTFNVSNYTVTQNRSITSVNETLTFPLNKTFNISVAYKLIFAVQGNSTANFTYSFLFPDFNVTAGRTTNASNWANITNGINVTIPPSNATYSAAYIVENVSVSTGTGGTDTRYVNATSPNINGTAQYYKIAFLMPSSFDPTTQHIRVRTYRLGSWATVGDGNLQQGENVASLQLYNFTTSNTSSYKDTVAVMLDLSNEHILEFSIQSGAEDVPSTPSGGGGGGSAYSTTNSTTLNGKELPSVAAFGTISATLDTFLRGKTAGVSNAGISILAMLFFLGKLRSRGGAAGFASLMTMFSIAIIAFYYWGFIL